VYVELPQVGAVVESRQAAAVVESVKAASDIYSPVSGEVVEVNPDLESNPALVNTDPYNAGWLFKVKLSNPQEISSLKTAAEYRIQIGT
jgi:glycine cleavage system H protein